MMAYVDHLISTSVVPVDVIKNIKKGQDLTYLVAFVAVGLFFSMMSLALTSAEWLPEGAITVALASAG
jgi:hypothetical protein